MERPVPADIDRMHAVNVCERARYPRSPAPLLRRFVRDDPHFMNFRRVGEHVACFDLLHQRSGNLSVEMRVASSLIIKGIEYRERGRSFLYRIPRRSSWARHSPKQPPTAGSPRFRFLYPAWLEAERIGRTLSFPSFLFLELFSAASGTILDRSPRSFFRARASIYLRRALLTQFPGLHPRPARLVSVGVKVDHALSTEPQYITRLACAEVWCESPIATPLAPLGSRPHMVVDRHWQTSRNRLRGEDVQKK